MELIQRRLVRPELRGQCLLAAACLLIVPLASAVGLAATANFDASPPVKAPEGWTAGKTGRGSPAWTVVGSPDAPSPPNVLQQSGTATYPICTLNSTPLRDGFVAVKFKTVSGREDQAAGLVWRLSDENNYY